MFADNRLFTNVHHNRRTGAIGRLNHTDFMTTLPVKRPMRITEHPANRDRFLEKAL